jgi:ABC-type dipeptide/oligopeptide/nickel transport system permease subunit
MGRAENRRLQKNQDKQNKILSEENFSLAFEFPPNVLAQFGPIITANLSITDTHAQYLSTNSLPIPPPVSCRFLIDTGATRSMVKHSFAEKAGLKLINENTPVHGVGVDTSGKTYLGRILFGAESKLVKGVSQLMWVDAQIISGTLGDSQFIDGLIGRDVLYHFDLRINGRTGRTTMTHIKLK